jgi:hypothetical protein
MQSEPTGKVKTTKCVNRGNKPDSSHSICLIRSLNTKCVNIPTWLSSDGNRKNHQKRSNSHHGNLKFLKNGDNV